MNRKPATERAAVPFASARLRVFVARYAACDVGAEMNLRRTSLAVPTVASVPSVPLALFVLALSAGASATACSSSPSDAGDPGAASNDGTGSGSTGGAGSGAGAGGDGGAGAASGDDAGGTGDDGGASLGGGLPFTCTNTKIASSPCPPPSGKSGEASFCMRPQWAGVTSVEVYGGFGQATDWQQPFATFTNDGTGTFTAKTALPNGTYPYMFRVHGAADGFVRDGMYLLDQENPSFVPHPAGAPVQRSVSSLTVPQTVAPVQHVRGSVVYEGRPQPCYAVQLEAGELTKAGGGVLSEHYTANFAESAPDGTFDFPVATGPFGVIVKFPFYLSPAAYPDPSKTPSVGVARTGTTVTAGADVALDAAEISYPETEYAKLTPASGASVALPVTFTFSVVPGSSAASVSVISTNIAGNDPLYWSSFGTTTTQPWDGTFGGTQGNAKLGVPYWWGSWQKRSVWTEESLLYPITFH